MKYPFDLVYVDMKQYMYKDEAVPYGDINFSGGVLWAHFPVGTILSKSVE